MDGWQVSTRGLLHKRYHIDLTYADVLGEQQENDRTHESSHERL